MHNAIADRLSGKNIFITGGTGFIGGRVIEKLIDVYQANIKVLVSTYHNLPRVARYPVEIVQGSILDPEVVNDGMKGCDIVIHCAFGNKGSNAEKRQVTVDGTKNILDACRINNIDRMVHLSTFRVYELYQEGVLDESGAISSKRDEYADSKLEAEKIVLDYHKRYGVPVTILQPTTVYGPFAPVWTVNVIEQLKKGKVILINNGDGYCNAVYIDDVVDAILLASDNDNAVGEKFLIAPEKPITWREFYQAYEAILHNDATVSMSAVDAYTLYKRHNKKNSVVSTIYRLLVNGINNKENLKKISASREALFTIKVLDKLGIYEHLRNIISRKLHSSHSDLQDYSSQDNYSKDMNILTPDKIDYVSKKTVVSISKAREVLGYNPAFDFKRGIEITKQWIIWANLTNEPDQYKQLETHLYN